MDHLLKASDILSAIQIPLYILPISFLLLLSLSCCCCCRKPRDKTDYFLLLSTALRQLLHPAQSQWPSSYLKAIKNAAKVKGRVLSFSLDSLLHDVRQNSIQLRNPGKHIKELILRGRVSLLEEVTVDFFAENSLISSLLIWKVNGYYLWASKKVTFNYCAHHIPLTIHQTEMTAYMLGEIIIVTIILRPGNSQCA
jgi:hypothetical protein